MSIFDKFKLGLNKSSKNLSTGLNDLIFKKKIDQNMLNELEDFLIQSDVGVEAAKELREKFSNTKINPKTEIIIGLPTRGLLSKILKNLLLQFNAHDNFLNNYQEIVQVIEKYTIQITKPRNICSAKKNFHLQFKQ